MEELIPLYTPDGNPSGARALKSVAHRKGWWHGTVHLWLVDTDGRVVFQRRSLNKLVFPGLWDISVAGHITGWEDPIQAVIRETKEELGISIAPNRLEYLGQFRSEANHRRDLTDREIHHSYLYRNTVDLDRIVPDPEEVDGVNSFPREILETLHGPEAPIEFVRHEWPYLEVVTRGIRTLFP